VKLLSLLIVLSVLFSTLCAATDRTIVVIGEISDSQCVFNIHSSDGTHAAMIKTDTLGKNAEQCTSTCVRMGGQYVLADTVNDKLYRLSNPALAIEFAGKRVRVRGVADDKGIFSIIDIKNR
jgi:hypothetical protein